MELKMLTGLSGPEYSLSRGDTRDFDLREAVRLVDAGFAKPTDQKAYDPAVAELAEDDPQAKADADAFAAAEAQAKQDADAKAKSDAEAAAAVEAKAKAEADAKSAAAAAKAVPAKKPAAPKKAKP